MNIEICPEGLRIVRWPEGDRVENPECLSELVEMGMCPFCFKFIDLEHLPCGSDERPYCEGPIIPPDYLRPLCPFCEHLNAIPFPLDSEMDCEECGAAI